MRRYLLIGAAVALLAIPTLASGRATTNVELTDSNRYTPPNVTKNVGAGAIHWEWGTSGHTFAAHNVFQDDKLFSSGSLTNSKPAGYTVTPSAGSFHYYCQLHGSPNGGMAGTIKIRPAIFNRTATSFGVRWSPGTNQTGNRFDVRYRVDAGPWKLWKNHVAAAQAIFGAQSKPVRVTPGHTYQIQARSEKSTNLNKKSDWSPSARVTT